MKTFALIIFLLLVGLLAGFFLSQRFNISISQKEEIKPTIAVSPTRALVGNDKDEHGCIGSAGYSWCELKQKCLRSWEEPCTLATPTISTQADSDAIKAALYKKNNWQEGIVTVTISTDDGKYASGTATALGGGGYFYAAKVNSEWKIVADGNGVIMCDLLLPYPDYPKSLIPECYNQSTGQTVKR